MKHAAGRQGGFTLIEVLVAMVVLSIGIMSIFALQMIATQGNSGSERLTAATAFGSQQVETLLTIPASNAIFNENATLLTAGLGGLVSGIPLCCRNDATGRYEDGLGNAVLLGSCNNLVADACLGTTQDGMYGAMLDVGPTGIDGSVDFQVTVVYDHRGVRKRVNFEALRVRLR